MANLALNCWNKPLYFHYQNLIQTHDNLSATTLTQKLVSEKLSSRLLYYKDLVGHFGCVNAIEFSKKGGEYLVSGGDDTRILVWKLAQAAVNGRVTPRYLKTTHLSNIFCASFDNENQHVITAGNDDQILRHNFETGELVSCFNVTDATYDVSVHPENDNIFIAAGEHGEVELFDVRAPSDPIKLANTPLTFHSAVFNPVDSAVFATASSVKGVQLWDARAPLRCLKTFDSRAGSQCAMGVTFDETGQYLAAVRQQLPPVLYHIHRNTTLVEFYQDGYYNSCTMKSVCFGGKTDNFIISGSDDFNIYMWEIPKVNKDYEGIMKVNGSFLVLRGHRSIVNQVCFNKYTSMLCTAGVEKIIKMWSPFPMAGGKVGTTAEDNGEQNRSLYSRMDFARMILESGRPLAHDYEEESTSEDPRMIAFFDTLVQTEHNSSTDSDLSSTDDDNNDLDDHVGGDDGGEENSRIVLQRMRAIVFEQIRNRRENEVQVTSRSDESDHDEISDVNQRETSDETRSNHDKGKEGVDIIRLREIITSQQSSTNVKKKIADLRRDCLKNEEDDAGMSSNKFPECENEENHGRESGNEFPECSSWNREVREELSSEKHISDSSCSSENEDQTKNDSHKKTNDSFSECSHQGQRNCEQCKNNDDT